MHWNLNDFTILSEYFHLKKNYVLPLYQISTFLEWNLQLLFRCLFSFFFPTQKHGDAVRWEGCLVHYLPLLTPYTSAGIIARQHYSFWKLSRMSKGLQCGQWHCSDLTVNTGNKQEGKDLNPQPTLKIRRDLFVLGFTVWFFQWKLLMLTNHH